MSDLRTKAIKGIGWSLIERIAQQAVAVVISIILARLLMPSEFGLVAMLTIFITIAKTFLDSGFGFALIQKKQTSLIDECSIFYFNLAVGGLLFLVLFLSAPWIAKFYNKPILVSLTRVLSINVLINAFGVIQTALLTKNLDFKTQFKIAVASSFISGTIGIYLAYSGYGVWSLVAQSILSNLVRTVLLWIFNSWKPEMVFSLNSLREMFGFGSKILFSALLETIYNNVYYVIIGKMFNSEELGYYARAKSMEQIPTVNITHSISRVAFPVYSKIQSDKIRLKQGVKRSLTSVSFIMFPTMIGLAVIAKPLILVLLTEKWLPSLPYFQLFCLLGILYPLHAVNLDVLKAQGRSEVYLKLEIIKKVLSVISIIITYRWGILAMIYGQLGASLVCYYANAYYTGKYLDYNIIEQLKDIVFPLVLSIMMATSVCVLDYVIFDHAIIELIVKILTGLAVYTVLYASIKGDELKVMLSYMRKTKK